MSSSRPSKRARTSAPAHSADDVLEIDPKGDLVIKVGTSPGVLMRVSSKHLSSASNVFDTLLSPNFAEGQTTHDTSNPLTLPDDNPTHMEILFKIIHSKIETATDIGSKDLAGIVLVSDKYDCIKAARFYVQTLLLNWLRDGENARSLLWKKRNRLRAPKYEGMSLPEALTIAYIMEDAALFSEISNQLFKKLDKAEISDMPKKLLELLPHDFRGKTTLTVR
jgi:hypothetical protein